MKKSLLFAFMGFGLGLGAPVGALLYLYIFHPTLMSFSYFLKDQWGTNGFFYRYMLLGTCAAFSLFGHVLGRYVDIILIRDHRHSREALTDPLTGLGNHRFLHQTFQSHYAKRKEDSKPFSCLMLDLDFFKKVNDTYGHSFGDEVLSIFADILQRMIRPGDIATRYGGEEFLCILPNCGKEEARQVAERARKEIEKEIFFLKKNEVRITVSVGAATLTGKGKNYQDLIRKADQALYRAKESGRNKVVIA